MKIIIFADSAEVAANNCKWRCNGVVLNEDCTKVIQKWFCEIDSYDPDIGCNRN